MSKSKKTELKRYYYDDKLEAGIDEAGRGPLFGAVFIGAAILPPGDDFNHSLMRDSKKLSERNRLIAYDYIKENAVDWSVFSYSEKKIDEMNILSATLDGMHKALDKLLVKPEHILVDGNMFKPYWLEDEIIPYTCIRGGDDKYTPIAAASIIAKVERDKYIEKICDENPTFEEYYSIRSNKGYGAKKHLEGIKKYGITKYHRKTFGICKQYA